MAATMDAWMQSVSDARAKGDTHAVKWLTACWMPYPASARAAARSGPPPDAPAPTGPFKTGKVVFHNGTSRATVTRPASDAPTE
jgi:hypothetical protein